MTTPNDNGSDNGSDLIPQPHGGALRRRGKKGNRGGSGIKDRILEQLRDDLQLGIEQLGKELRSKTLTIDERIKYITLAAKYTTPVPKLGYNPELVSNLFRAVTEVVGDDEQLAAIEARWVALLAETLKT